MHLDRYALLTLFAYTQAPATTVTRYLCTLSRIAIADTNIFHELLRGIIANPPVPELALSYDELLRKLLAQWLDRVSGLASGTITFDLLNTPYALLPTPVIVRQSVLPGTAQAGRARLDLRRPLDQPGHSGPLRRDYHDMAFGPR